ncbi:galactosyldiacylglycerol synthase [Massilia sp. RP-1-19]|uniref:Galactosyldiacylglycerol synthase n=1 Tax=Massilia polaris TaxID=2728846 RepID=A0A848HFW7_9BURK|nr:glycosyltransferase [Massilia polaris]NML59862.1 galactosyldiacylglycerol synthase [Massilia polaris]
MGKTKILLVSASAGNGHTRAAEALRMHAQGPDVSVTHIDILKFVSPLLRTAYAKVYSGMVKHAPALWRHVYQSTHQAKRDGGGHALRRWAERINSARFVREIEKIAPDLIVCTHFLPADILSQLIARDGLSCPVWVQVTDFDLHPIWVHGHMAGYFVPNEEVAFRLREHGIAANQIHITGIPIMPGFSGHHDRDGCARELGIPAHRMTILLMGGGAGFGTVTDIAERLLRTDDDLHVITLAGRDKSTLAALNDLAARYPGRLSPLAHTDNIERLMACSDLVITKPGGLTTSESLAIGLPMVVIAPIPGQEEHNANFVLERGAALKAFDLLTLEYRVRYLLAHPARLAEMRANAHALGRPAAASRVLATILRQPTE